MLVPIVPSQAIPSGIQFPKGFYQVLDHPAPMAGCGFPFSFTGWEALYSLGFRSVVCLCSDLPKYEPAPLILEIACELDDLSEAALPAYPDREARRVRWLALEVLCRLNKGEGVLVHCAAGRGRTGTVLGAVLRLLGVPAKEVVAYLDELHFLRNGKGWPESPWQAKVLEDMK